MKKPNTLNNYPVVLLHGMAGWGESEWLTKLVPYFGFFRSNVLKLYRGMGYDAYVPTMGPFTGAWMRACDLWAQIVGGTVDYGKAYSERVGCERYGRTYDKPLIPDWGTLDAEGKRKKIVIIGHSYGAPTMKAFISLVAFGNEEERRVTPENELSELFKGGKEDWIHAGTTLAGCHNGLAMIEVFPLKAVLPVWSGLLFLFSLLFDYVGLAKRIWDMKLDAYKMTAEVGKTTSLSDKLKGAVVLGKQHFGNMAYDICFPGIDDLNATFPWPKNIYYFSYAGNAGRKNGDHYNWLPDKKSFMLTRFIAPLTGALKNPSKGVTDEWLPNDGLVPVISAVAPFNEPQDDFTALENCKPGVWYKFPVAKKDHHSFEGSGEDPAVYAAFMTEVLEHMENLPNVD